jgi:endonuclease YncB( thermonuclease family)
MQIKKMLAVAGACCACLAAQAAPMKVKVVSVMEGDVINVLMPSEDRLVLRVAGIDAPELTQEFGQKAVLTLAKMVEGKEVMATAITQDESRRYVTILNSNGRDVGLFMLLNGLAWTLEEDLEAMPEELAETYRTAVAEARAAKRGLWGGPHQIEPRRWREMVKKAQEAAASNGAGAPITDPRQAMERIQELRQKHGLN